MNGKVDKVRAELVAALLEDESRLGEVYRYLGEGLTAEEIAVRMEIASPGHAENYAQQVDAILDGRLPLNSHLASHTAGRLRRWQQSKTWTPPAREHLDSLLAGLENIATDVHLVERERNEAHRLTAEVEKLGLIGIYVYSLPHYLRFPYDPESGRTLCKVGHSTMDVYSGIGGEARTTALPEDPVLLRVYATEGKLSAQEERHFHEWLAAADHGRSRSARGNREWYLTTTKFLDRVARQRGLEITVVSADLDGAED
ncbi:MAG: hypothetical protein ACK5MT_09115 [Actinomycetales bacterium]